MADQRPTAYDLLGVAPQASSAEITSAYRRLLRRHHPDSRGLSQVGDTADQGVGPDGAAALRTIIEAYEVLRDPRGRADYDRRLGALTPRTTSSRAGADRDLLVGAGPVRWEEGRAPTGRTVNPTISAQELELMRQLVGILHRRWGYE